MARAESTTVKLTGYTCDPAMTPEQKAMNCPHGITRWTQKPPAAGRTVACPSHLKMRRVWIEGIGERVCEDTGGAIKGSKVDLFVDTYSEALKINRTVTMKVI